MKTVTTFLLATGIACGVSAESYPVADTGQTTAYGDYAGQDAHYSANPPAFRDNGDGTVSDIVTGLMWTRDPGDKLTHAQAVDNAADCSVGGFDDWRLPTIKQLYSLIDYRGTDHEADVSYAFGYLGDTMIQFIQQHDDTPSIYRDMFAAGVAYCGISNIASYWGAGCVRATR